MSSKSKVKYALVIPDTHIPFHDERAYNLMLKVAKTLPSVDEVCLLGDYGEFLKVGSYPKDPGLKVAFAAELAAINEKLDELDDMFPNADKVFIEGNHENRMTRYIRDKAPELFGVTSVKNLLHINEREDWKWVGYCPGQKHKVLGSKLYARHEPIGGGEHVAANTVKKSGSSVIFGHVHKIQEFQTVMLDGDNHRGITPGWLGDKNSSVFNYVPNHHQWALGFNITAVLPDKSFYSTTVHIIDYKCTYGSKLFTG